MLPPSTPPPLGAPPAGGGQPPAGGGSVDALAGYRKLSFAAHHAQNARLLAEGLAVGETAIPSLLHPLILSLAGVSTRMERGCQ